MKALKIIGEGVSLAETRCVQKRTHRGLGKYLGRISRFTISLDFRQDKR